MEQLKFLIEYLRASHSSDEGATAVEYSLLAALIAGGIIAVVTTLRGDIQALFTTLTAAI